MNQKGLIPIMSIHSKIKSTIAITRRNKQILTYKSRPIDQTAILMQSKHAEDLAGNIF